jgi:putative transposase
VEHAREKYEVSERHAYRLLGQWRRTQRYAAIQRIDEDALTEAIIALASEYGRCGHRRITALLLRDGWQVSKDRVQRTWSRPETRGGNRAFGENLTTAVLHAVTDCPLANIEPSA